MKLKAGCKEAYRERHANIWPELQDLLKKTGISGYAIFLDESTDTLFAFQYQSGESSSQDLGSNPIVQRWWAYMSDLMETHPDHSPVTDMLEEVFWME